MPISTPELRGSSKQESPVVISSKLVLTSTCEFAQDKLLGQTERNVETHAGPEVCEYKPGTALRVWVLGIGKRS